MPFCEIIPQTNTYASQTGEIYVKAEFGNFVLGSIFIPDGAITTLGSLFVDPVDQNILNQATNNSWGMSNYVSTIYSSIYNISLLGSVGSYELQEGATLGFFVNGNFNVSNLCLGYIDEQDYFWKCESNKLTWINNSYVQGVTSHFTTFAMVLDPSHTPSSPPGQKPNSTIPTWMIIAIVVPIAVAVMSIFCVMYWRQYLQHRRDLIQIQNACSNLEMNRDYLATSSTQTTNSI